MEQPLQSAAIEVGEAQELDTELAMVRPSNCGRVDGDRDSQFRSLDQQFDAGSRCHRYRTGHGTATGRKIERGPLADIGLIGHGKNNLELNGDAGMFATFDHGDSLRTSRPVTGGSTIGFSRKYRPPRFRWHAL